MAKKNEFTRCAWCGDWFRAKNVKHSCCCSECSKNYHRNGGVSKLPSKQVSLPEPPDPVEDEVDDLEDQAPDNVINYEGYELAPDQAMTLARIRSAHGLYASKSIHELYFGGEN